MILQKVVYILAEALGIDDKDITQSTKLTSAHGIEPVDVAKLVIECEKKFKLTIHDEDVHQFHTVEDVVAYIEKLQDEEP